MFRFENGRLIYSFSPEDWARCIVYAHERNDPKEKAGLTDYRVSSKSSLYSHFVGVLGEWPFCRLFGLPMHQLAGLKTDGRKPDYYLRGRGMHVKARDAIATFLIVPKRLHPLPDGDSIVGLRRFGRREMEFMGSISCRRFRETCTTEKFPPKFVPTPAVPYESLSPISVLMRWAGVKRPIEMIVAEQVEAMMNFRRPEQLSLLI